MTEVINNNTEYASNKIEETNYKSEEYNNPSVDSNNSEEYTKPVDNTYKPADNTNNSVQYYDRLDKYKTYRVKQLCTYTVEEVVAYLYNCQVRKQHTQINNTYKKKQEPVPEDKYHKFVDVKDIVYDCRTEYLNKAIKNLCTRASNLMNKSKDLEFLITNIKVFARKRGLAVTNDVLVYNNKFNKLCNIFRGMQYSSQVEAYRMIVAIMLKDTPPNIDTRLMIMNQHTTKAVNKFHNDQMNRDRQGDIQPYN